MLLKARERLTTIDAGATVRAAAALMSKPHTDIVVVCDRDGGMVGVVTKTDIVGHFGECKGNGCIAKIETIMRRDIVCCGPGGSLQDVWSSMKQSGMQRVPLLDRSRKPIGIIYARDALQNLLGDVESDEALLRDYVMSVGYR